MNEAEKMAREWLRAHEPTKEDTKQLIHQVAERTLEEVATRHFYGLRMADTIRACRWWEDEG